MTRTPKPTTARAVFDAMHANDVVRFSALNGSHALENPVFATAVLDLALDSGVCAVIIALVALHATPINHTHFVRAALAGQFDIAALFVRAGARFTEKQWLTAMHRFAAQHHETLRAVLVTFCLPTSRGTILTLLATLPCTVARRYVHLHARLLTKHGSARFSLAKDVHYAEQHCACARSTNPAAVPVLVPLSLN